MFGKSISAWFVSFLVMLGILPGGKSKVCDKIGFLVWLTISTALSFAFFYINKEYIEAYIKDISIASLMTLATSFLTQVVQMIGSVLTLSTVSKSYPFLVSDRKLPLPDCLLFFLIVTLSNIVYLPTTIEGMVLYPDLLARVTFVMVCVLFAENVYISSIIIGICVAQLKIAIQSKEHLTNPSAAIYFGEKVVKEFRSLKQFLSPVMFVLFLVNSLNVIGDGYFTLLLSNLILIPRLVYSFLTLGYVCLVIDGCFGEFKSVADTLR